MELHDKKYKLVHLPEVPYDNVPRGVFLAEDGSEITLDYHGGLLKLSIGDVVRIKLYDSHPEIDKNIYLMYGWTYNIENDILECSFWGLLLIYKGRIHPSIKLNTEIYVSVEKVLEY